MQRGGAQARQCSSTVSVLARIRATSSTRIYVGTARLKCRAYNRKALATRESETRFVKLVATRTIMDGSMIPVGTVAPLNTSCLGCIFHVDVLIVKTFNSIDVKIYG